MRTRTIIAGLVVGLSLGTLVFAQKPESKSAPKEASPSEKHAPKKVSSGGCNDRIVAIVAWKDNRIMVSQEHRAQAAKALGVKNASANSWTVVVKGHESHSAIPVLAYSGFLGDSSEMGDSVVSYGSSCTHSHPARQAACHQVRTGGENFWATESFDYYNTCEASPDPNSTCTHERKKIGQTDMYSTSSCTGAATTKDYHDDVCQQ